LHDLRLALDRAWTGHDRDAPVADTDAEADVDHRVFPADFPAGELERLEDRNTGFDSRHRLDRGEARLPPLVSDAADDRALDAVNRVRTVAEIDKRVFEALRTNFQEEAAIERDAERILDENKRQTVGMDQRTLLVKIKERLARERGFVLRRGSVGCQVFVRRHEIRIHITLARFGSCREAPLSGR